MSHYDNPTYADLGIRCNNGFLDESFYESAINQNNLRYLDYYHARVMHNPRYCECMISDYLDIINPRLKNKTSPVLEDSLELQMPTTLSTSDGSTQVGQATISRTQFLSIKIIDQNNQVILDSLVDSFVNRILLEPKDDHNNLLYMLACYVFWSNVEPHNDILKPYLDKINQFYCFTYNELYKQLELSVWKGGKLKEKFKFILNEVLEDMKIGGY